jgi:Putative auto-transporter adhesin, head GIN domain
MKNYILAGLFLFLASAVLSQQTVISDPNVETRQASGFHAIEVSNAIDLFLSQSGHESIAVSAKEIKDRDRIRTEVVAGVLKIWFDNKGWKWEKGNKHLRAYVSFQTLDKLEASGASDVQVDGQISSDKLDIRLSGASDFKGIVQVEELSIDQSGASDVQISGKASSLRIEASGASDVKGYELTSEKCTVQASGASDIQITVNKELNAHASGASSVNYKGEAMIKEMHTSGASSIGRKG